MAADTTTTARTVPGPAKDWLTESDVLGFLETSSSTLDRYIQLGKFPAGIPWGRERRWRWEDVVWFLLGKQIEARLAAAARPPTDDQ